jgi:glycosyltransferase involved in cell wall biosynthesis
VRALHVFPTYPGEPDEGSSIYARALNRELARRGVELELLTTRARHLRMRRMFHIDWPDELERRDVVDGVPLDRFRSVSLPASAGALADRLARRRWRRIAPATDPDELDPQTLFATGPRWSRGADLAARLGRGPLVPGLLAALGRRAGRCDLVLAGHAPFGLMGWVQSVARLRGRRVVLLPFIHEADPFHHLPSLHRAYREAAAVLTLSVHTAELLHEHVPGSRPIAVGAGADLATFDAPGISGERFRSAHGLGDRRILLFVGRKDAGKRYDLALRAAAGAGDGATLVLVGKDVDGKPLPRGVLHLERLDPSELADAYDACDLFLHPSEQESFGMVCLEAWLRRKPVLANRACGASAALISDGEDGLLCGEPSEWSGAVARLFSEPDEARRMGEAGRDKVLARFTWERVGRRVHELYRELSDGRTA